MSLIKTDKLSFDYKKYDENGNIESVKRALKDIDFTVEQGDFVTILGSNGSGKSTLAKHLNAIFMPAEGTVMVDGLDTRDAANTWEVRKRAGMVFQNPDNQIIGQVVEEDVGFGPENIGIPTSEIWERVEESLRVVGMYEFRKHSPNKLSGGQKQRVSIAGIIAMHPKCIILDEPTAMLDPNGRKDVIRAARALNEVENVTVILITHYMEEVIYSNKVIVMDAGEIRMTGTPKEIFSRADELKELRLDVPQITLLALNLKKNGVDLPDGILTIDELVTELKKLKGWN
ncbi:MAG: energy-coupling factor transporter ATPase [Lachnospiraceae bacterium]|nr:energy-coupling factor transporter ATPase [Lachnospiraceae bacterium]